MSHGIPKILGLFFSSLSSSGKLSLSSILLLMNSLKFICASLNISFNLLYASQASLADSTPINILST
ncbi:unnamed protein product [Meloidogyne enterolobii]|uniref:Uncharacterized protein n=1 Tax=Meloidogyne enterolobii TaxID=390850 RepID=A0ACB0Z1M7_MELEN